LCKITAAGVKTTFEHLFTRSALPDARLLSDDVLEALRLRALRGCELGYTEAQVADILGVARETVSRWFAAYHAGGLDALPHDRTGRPLGSGRALSDEQAAHLQAILDSRNPEEVGVAAPLWNRRAVRELIRNEYHIDLAVRTVGAYLRRWGYTAKRPRRRARDQDPEEVREWLEEIYPGIEERAAQGGATIHGCDETGVAADEHPGNGYARRGRPALAEVPDSHVRVNMISAIGNAGSVHFMTYTRAMTAALFILFLGRLLRSTTGKIYLIVDRLQAHLTAEVFAWAEAQADRLELFHLPPYVPELNADEYLNHDVKEGVNGAGLPDSKPALRSQLQAFMRRLVHLPEHVRSYFQHPCVQYAAAIPV
jgi:transposase